MYIPASSKGRSLKPSKWCFSAPLIIHSAPLGSYFMAPLMLTIMSGFWQGLGFVGCPGAPQNDLSSHDISWHTSKLIDVLRVLLVDFLHDVSRCSLTTVLSWFSFVEVLRGWRLCKCYDRMHLQYVPSLDQTQTQARRMKTRFMIVWHGGDFPKLGLARIPARILFISVGQLMDYCNWWILEQQKTNERCPKKRIGTDWFELYCEI